MVIGFQLMAYNNALVVASAVVDNNYVDSCTCRHRCWCRLLGGTEYLIMSSCI